MLKRVFILLICISLLGILNAQRLKIAVSAFENKSDYPYSIAPIRDMIVNELFKSGKFSIFEREKLNILVKEKQLSQSGIVDGGYSEKFKGVDAIVYGSVTSFGVKEDTKGGLGGSLKWGLLGGQKKKTVEVRIHLRIIAVNTGEILGSAEAVGSRYLKKGIGLGLFAGVPVLWGSTGFDNTMIGRATKIAVADAVRIIERTTKNLYSQIRSDGKIYNKYREKYPSIFEPRKREVEKYYKVSSQKRNIKVFVSVTESNMNYDKNVSIVEQKIISALKKDGYPVVSDRKNATVLIDGFSKSYYVATIFDRLSGASDYKSAGAKVELKVFNLTNGAVIDTFSYSLPKPRLHIREELAGEKALSELANLTADRVTSILDKADINIVRKTVKRIKKKIYSGKTVEVTVSNLKKFNMLYELKKQLKLNKLSSEIKNADFNSGNAIISVKHTTPFELANKLSEIGYKIKSLSGDKITVTK